MDDLRRRLRRLGVISGREFQPKPKATAGPDIDGLTDGKVIETDAGPCFVIEMSYLLDTRHWGRQLAEWLALDASGLALVGANDELADVPLHHYLFLDTETTGLGGGSFAFQVGVGFFTEDAFEIRQYFLRDPAEESAMLHLLAELVGPNWALVTFNGLTFDVPLLADRYILNRQRTLIAALPNLDLLHPARRLWRRRLPSCSLGALETDILGLGRAQQDVPGSLIPYLYRQYLQTKHARDMVRVLYHNEQDLLSMVTLGVEIAQTFGQPEAPSLPVEDRISLARWYANQNMQAEAEVAYTLAAAEAPDTETRYDALHGLAYLLKRTERRHEAVSLWQDLADLKMDTLGHEELAKHYEWQEGDLDTALHWTEAALGLVQSWRPGLRQTEALKTFNHRRDRLLRKLNGLDTEESGEE
jgi:uncharacterized protein YprB with RNaseH-like and TPR domain